MSTNFVVPIANEDNNSYSYYIEESNITPANVTTASIVDDDGNGVDEDNRVTLEDGGTQVITATNIVPPSTQVKVRKVWSDGTDAHTSDSVKVNLNKQRDGETTTSEVETVTLDASNNWAYTWSSLPTVEDVDGTYVDLTYSVTEGDVTSSAAEIETSYMTVSDTDGKMVIITNTPTYKGNVALQKTFVGLPDELTDEQQAAVNGLEFEITTGAGEALKYVKIETSTGEIKEIDKTDLDAAAEGAYRNIRYSDLTEDNHTLTFATNVESGTTYSVTEINPGSLEGLKDSYSLIVADSITSGSDSAPKSGTNTISLTNTYDEIKGSITVNKEICLNDRLAPDDVAATQRFKLGLEYCNTNDPDNPDDDTWEVVTDPSDETNTSPWIQTVVIGSGSTASTTFDNIALGTYRAYEVDDNGNRVAANADSAVINGITWYLSSEGIYYNYTTYDGTATDERQMHTNMNSICTEAYVTLSGDDGGVDDMAPRNAEITITNNKNESGSIVVNKTLLYNGVADPGSKTFYFGLYKDANATQPVTDPDDSSKKWVVSLMTASSDDESTTDVDETGKGTATFSPVKYDTTYYVFEIDEEGQPVGEGYEYQVLSSQPTVEDGIALSRDDHDKSTEVKNNEVKTNLKATKAYLGADGTALTPWPCDFELVLSTEHTEADGVHMPDSEELTKTATQTEPTVTFGEIYFTKAGTFTFAISETIPAEENRETGITYDESAKTVTVVVAEKVNAGGALEIQSVEYPEDDTAETGATVTNQVTDTSIKVTKEWNGNNSNDISSVTYKLYQTYTRDAKEGLEESDRIVTTEYTADLPNGTTTRTLSYHEAVAADPDNSIEAAEAYWDTVEIESLPKYVYNTDDSKWYEASYYVVETITEDDKYAATYRLGGDAGAEGVETASNVKTNTADNVLTIINKDTAKEFKFRKVWMDSNENTANSVEWVKDISVILYGKKSGEEDAVVHVYTLSNVSDEDAEEYPYTVTLVEERIGDKAYKSYEFYMTGLPADYDSFYVVESDLDGYAIDYRSATEEGGVKTFAEERRENSEEDDYIINRLVQVSLPSTGGFGTTPLRFAGIIMILMASGGLYIKSKYSRKN